MTKEITPEEVNVNGQEKWSMIIEEIELLGRKHDKGEITVGQYSKMYKNLIRLMAAEISTKVAKAENKAAIHELEALTDPSDTPLQQYVANRLAELRQYNG